MADELSTRARNCLGRHLRPGIIDYGYKQHPIRPEEVVANLTWRDLLLTANMGPKTRAEVVEWLRLHGLELKP